MRIRSFFVFVAITVFFLKGAAQQMVRPSDTEISRLPEWAKAMYSGKVSAYVCDSMYQDYYRSHPFKKSYHTQYYKRWRRKNQTRLDAKGFPVIQTEKERNDIESEYIKKQSGDKTTSWKIIGPIKNHEPEGKPGTGQANIYSLSVCTSQPAIMYCGTEPGEVYKSLDSARTWSLVSKTIDFGSGVTAVSVHPILTEVVLAGGNNGLYRSTNGGQVWIRVLAGSDLGFNEFYQSETIPGRAFAATDKGFYSSQDTGRTWQQVFSQKSYDIKQKPGNGNHFFLLKNNPAEKRCEFFRSTDGGQNWIQSTNGWYNSTDPNRTDGGARLAVSPVDSSRVYAYLIGESKADDIGFIGIYKSTDGGISWTLPAGFTGGPYSASHPNLAVGSPDWAYHQGFYNCAFMASKENADHILVGGLNLWKSTNGGVSFQGMAGYIGGPLNMHVDMQDFRPGSASDYWITTDGGIYRAPDFFSTQPSFRMTGVHASDYWGFGSGWNEDVLVGGLYHNGNLAYHENYGAGNFLELGGGEAPTGYVNPGQNRKTYFSDIGGRTLPRNLTDPIAGAAFGISPNESYFAAESSEMEFHPNCYNIAWVGKDNAIWKTTDGGGSFFKLFSFGTVLGSQVKYIEVASSKPDVLYVTQQAASGGAGKLWKTTNGGTSWNAVTLPGGNSRRILLALDPANENHLFMAFPDAGNTTKIYETSNGGTNWTNRSNALLNNESIQSLAFIPGAGLYAATQKAVYYRNLAGTWVIANQGLPTFTNGNILKPFFRDGKIRLATYGKGIWESELEEIPANPLSRPTVNQLSQTVVCKRDSLYFEDYSFLLHNGSTWEWTFPGGSPSASNKRNPVVLYPTDGIFPVYLKVRNGAGLESIDTISVQIQSLALPTGVAQDFEGSFPPAAWSIDNPGQDAQWGLSTQVGGFGNSAQSALFDNYNNHSQGKSDDLRMNLSGSELSANGMLRFDVAYARWGSANSDTLEILISDDCGQTFEQLYRQGGTDLSTTGEDVQVLFVPTADQWRTDSVDLSAYAGSEKLLVAFRNKGHYGNAMYLDNVQLGTPVSVRKNEGRPVLRIWPNPVKRGSCLHVETGAPGMLEWQDVTGKSLKKVPVANEVQIDIPTNTKPGVYNLRFVGSDWILNRKVVVW